MEELRFTPKEQDVLRVLLDDEVELERAIPDSIDHKDLWYSLSVACRAAALATRMSLRLRPVIGRMLVVVRNNPEFYKERGYKHFEDFLERGVCADLGLSRSDAYDAKKVAIAFPSLSPEQYAAIGPSKLSIAAKITSEEQTGHKKILKLAAELTITQFREFAEQKKLVNKGEATPAVIVIPTTQEIAHHWKEWSSNAEVQAWGGGGSDRGVLLEAMIAECSNQIDVEKESQ